MNYQMLTDFQNLSLARTLVSKSAVHYNLKRIAASALWNAVPYWLWGRVTEAQKALKLLHANYT